MVGTTVQRRAVAWLALLALVLGSLAPAWAHALSGSRVPAWVEVCTAEGPQWVSMGASGSGATGPALPSAGHTEHCPYCSLHAPTPGLPPAAAEGLPRLARVYSVPGAPAQAAQHEPVWLNARPRAPPPLR
jgi:hypothetical protein